MKNFTFSKIRIARPTNKLSDLVTFYTEGLGLKMLASFKDHDGYDGAMLGLPNWEYHLEFTQHADITECSAPTKDNLLVFYMSQLDRDELAEHLLSLGTLEVEAENPYWRVNGRTFEDPEKWRVVLVAE